MNWVDRFPERFAYELAEFERRGLAFTLDEARLRRDGRVVLRGAIDIEGEPGPVALEVRYPDSFPYFRPEVFAPNLELRRHQNPVERNLCLLDRSSRAWNPSETAAELIETQVPHLLGLLRGDAEAMTLAEAPQGEPVSAYFPPLAGTFVLIPQELLEVPADAVSGAARIAFSPTEPPALRLRGLLQSASVREGGGRSKRIADAGQPLTGRFAGGRSIEIGWIRIAELPRRREPQALLAAAERAVPGSTRPNWQDVSDGTIAVLGLVFREEIEQGIYGDQWLFVVQTRHRIGRLTQEGVYTTRGERLSLIDLQARIPQLGALSQRRVALVGLGGLGAPLAIELVRASVGELRVLDFDIVEAGTTVRWPYGLSAINAPKPDFIAQVVGRDYPFTTIIAITHHLGDAMDTQTESDFDVLYSMFDGVDLVIDASAEIGVQQLVSSIADELGLPQIYLWATEGARGGVVARVIPGATGCWYCLQLALDRESVPLPARDETGTVQPRGCASRTFTGAAFDLAPIFAQAARVAASALVSGQRIGNEDVSVCSLAAMPSPAPPEWLTSPLERQEGCPCCGAEHVAA